MNPKFFTRWLMIWLTVNGFLFAPAMMSYGKTEPATGGTRRETVREESDNERHGRGVLGRLRREKPEKLEELMKLREEDREAFREHLREEARKMRLRERNNMMKACSSRIRNLVQKYRQAPTEEEQEKFKQELYETLERSFEQRIERYQKRIEEMTEKLESMREELGKRKEKREQLLERQLQFMLDREERD